MVAKKILVALLIIANAVIGQTKEQLFSDADDLLLRLKELNAETLSPKNFALGKKYYDKAVRLYEEGKSKEEVFSALQNAEGYFYKAIERAKINNDLFAYVLKVRKRAYAKAGESGSAEKFLLKGEKEFAEGISASENEGERDTIKAKINNAIKSFNAAIIISEKEKVFAPTVELRDAALKAEAKIYSPDEFAEGEKRFNDAIEFAGADNGEDFIKSLYAAEKFFKKAYSNSVLITANNGSLKTAVDFAKKANAEKYAPTQWHKAVETLSKASKEFEERNYKEYKKDITLATKQFWDAEEKAIYNKYINAPKRRLAELKESETEQFAFASIRKTQLLLDKAEKLFEQNRYEKQIPVIYEKALDELDRLESIKKISETKGREYIDSLILNEIYPFGDKKNSESKVAEAPADSAHAFVSLPKPIVQGSKKEEKSMKETDFAEKNENSVSEIETQKTVVAERKTPLEKTLDYFYKTFGEEEAIIVEKKKDSFRIRLTGLKLKAYQKKLNSRQKNLLMKLHNVILYSRKVGKVLIEVYSDSKGGDDLNKRLSQSRANIVKSTLVKYGIPKKIITAKGIGNKNPIASNATFEGRNKNRRIEVILYFRD